MKETVERRLARQAGQRLLAEHMYEDPFTAAFKATRMPMLITDPRQHDNPIIFCNNAFCELSGYSQAELVGRNCRLLQGEGTDPEAIARIKDAVAAEKDLAIDILNYRKDGASFWNALFVSPVRDDAGEVIYFFASQLDFTNIKSKEAELAAARHFAEEEVQKRTADLQSALETKTVLVHEVDHRVKNNLMTIASIVKAQARISEDEIARKTLRSVLDRVEALSTVQRKLLNNDDIGHFDVAEFTRELIQDRIGGLNRTDIEVRMDLHEVIVPAAKASPIALVVNELVGDAIRRGLGDYGGQIHVEVRRLNGHFLIRVSDTASPVKVDKGQQAFGALLLETSARQLGARIEKKCEGDRTDVHVTMLVDEHKD